MVATQFRQFLFINIWGFNLRQHGHQQNRKNKQTNIENQSLSRVTKNHLGYLHIWVCLNVLTQ